MNRARRRALQKTAHRHQPTASKTDGEGNVHTLCGECLEYWPCSISLLANRPT